MTEPVYDRIGTGYAHQRRPEPAWQARVDAALGSARTVLNVGAGTGSYEPDDRYVLAVEPSTAMIRQRPDGAAPALQASAEDLPIADRQFDVAMAIVTLHHWRDWSAGVREMLRVADRAVIVHFDPDLHSGFWLVRDYLPELAEVWRDVPSVDDVAESLGAALSRGIASLRTDLQDGSWQRKNASLLHADELDAGWRLIFTPEAV